MSEPNANPEHGEGESSTTNDQFRDQKQHGAIRGRDSALNRVLHGWGRAPATIDPALRRVQGLELLVVLAIFPLTSVWAAVTDLIERIQTGFPVASHGIPPVNGQWLAVSLGIANVVFFSVPALLVWYLLTRSDEGLRAINLGDRRWRMDLAFLLPVFIVVQWFPQFVGAHILEASNLRGYFLFPAPLPVSPAGLSIYQIFASAQAGIVEEVVVLGYLVRRLEQRNFSVPSIVVIAVLVRVSYHLYYGWNTIPIACWALVTVLVYLRIRRLLPFIICHFAWDVAIPFRDYYHHAYSIMLLVATIASFACMCFWGRWHPDEDLRPNVAAGRGSLWPPGDVASPLV